MEHIQIAENDGWLKITKAGIDGQGWKRSSYEASTPSDVVTLGNHLSCERGNPGSPPQAERGHSHAQRGNPGSPNVATEGDHNSHITVNNNQPRTFLLKDKSEFIVDDQFYKILRGSYPDLNIDQEIQKIKAWAFSNPSKRKTRAGATRFVNAWMQRALSQQPAHLETGEFDFENQFKTV